MADPMSITAAKGQAAHAPLAGQQAHAHAHAQTQAHAARPTALADDAPAPAPARAPTPARAKAPAPVPVKAQEGPEARITSDALRGAQAGPDGPRPQDAQRPEPKQEARPEPPADQAARAARAARLAQDDRTAAEAVETLREYLGGLPSELQFDYDKEAGRQVFKVVNPVTHEVVKQYPPEEFLAMIKRLKELDRNADKNGMLFDDRY